MLHVFYFTKTNDKNLKTTCMGKTWKILKEKYSATIEISEYLHCKRALINLKSTYSLTLPFYFYKLKVVKGYKFVVRR